MESYVLIQKTEIGLIQMVKTVYTETGSELNLDIAFPFLRETVLCWEVIVMHLHLS
jgi:hypothetical protein